MKCHHKDCQNPVEFRLIYEILPGLALQPPESTFDRYSCDTHIRYIESIFNPIQGIPIIVHDMDNNERPDILKRIEQDYNEWQTKQPV